MAIFNPQDANKYLFAEGEAKFRLVKATEEISQNGKRPQFKFVFDVRDANGKIGTLTEYYSLESEWLWKLKRVCEAMGGELPDLFAGGSLTDGQINSQVRTGKFVLKTQVDPKGVYDDKSVVAKYIKKEKLTPDQEMERDKDGDEFHDDDIPF